MSQISMNAEKIVMVAHRTVPTQLDHTHAVVTLGITLNLMGNHVQVRQFCTVMAHFF